MRRPRLMGVGPKGCVVRGEAAFGGCFAVPWQTGADRDRPGHDEENASNALNHTSADFERLPFSNRESVGWEANAGSVGRGADGWSSTRNRSAGTVVLDPGNQIEGFPSIRAFTLSRSPMDLQGAWPAPDPSSTRACPDRIPYPPSSASKLEESQSL